MKYENGARCAGIDQEKRYICVSLEWGAAPWDTMQLVGQVLRATSGTPRIYHVQGDHDDQVHYLVTNDLTINENQAGRLYRTRMKRLLESGKNNKLEEGKDIIVMSAGIALLKEMKSQEV